jgi:hypothetical protein
MECLEKKVRKGKKKVTRIRRKVTKSIERIRQIPSKTKKLEAICAEGVLGNKKAEKRARTNRCNREFKGLDKNGNPIRGIKQH